MGVPAWLKRVRVASRIDIAVGVGVARKVTAVNTVSVPTNCTA